MPLVAGLDPGPAMAPGPCPEAGADTAQRARRGAGVLPPARAARWAGLVGGLADFPGRGSQLADPGVCRGPDRRHDRERLRQRPARRSQRCREQPHLPHHRLHLVQGAGVEPRRDADELLASPGRPDPSGPAHERMRLPWGGHRWSASRPGPARPQPHRVPRGALRSCEKPGQGPSRWECSPMGSGSSAARARYRNRSSPQ